MRIILGLILVGLLSWVTIIMAHPVDRDYNDLTLGEYTWLEKKIVIEAVTTYEGWYEESRSYRNNNPGNIRGGSYATWRGAIGVDKDGFAIFETVKDGEAALEHLLFESKTYPTLNLKDAIFRYAPTNENHSQAYYEFVLKRLVA